MNLYLQIFFYKQNLSSYPCLFSGYAITEAPFIRVSQFSGLI